MKMVRNLLIKVLYKNKILLILFFNNEIYKIMPCTHLTKLYP